MKTLFKAVATVTIFSILTRFLGFLFRIFLSRKLGATGIGIFQMASSILGLFMTLFSSGIPLTTAKFVSKYRTNNQISSKHKFVTSALIVSILISIIASILIYILKPLWHVLFTDINAVEILIILIPSLFVSAVYVVFRGSLWGDGDYFSCGLTEFIEQIARFIITFVLLINVNNVIIATKNSAIAFNIACTISAILCVVIYFKKDKLNFKKGEYKNLIKSSTPVTGIRLASSLVQPITTLILPSLLIMSGQTQSEAISSFGTIMGMTFPMLFVQMSVIGSISMVLIPAISSLQTKGDYEQINSNILNSTKISIFISSIFVVLYMSVGDLIGLVLYNNAMAGILLKQAAMCVIPITVCNLSGSILDALGLEMKSLINYSIGSVILFLTLIIFTPLLKINSIILAFFISMSVISILNYIQIKKKIKNFHFNLTNYCFKFILTIIPSAVLGNFISSILLHFFTNFFAGLVGGLISIICMLWLISSFKIYNFTDLKDILKRKKAKT